MNLKVLSAARELVERAERDGQAGRLAAADDLDRLGRELGAHLPDWYRDLLATVPLIGLELGHARRTPRRPEVHETKLAGIILAQGRKRIGIRQ